MAYPLHICKDNTVIAGALYTIIPHQTPTKVNLQRQEKMIIWQARTGLIPYSLCPARLDVDIAIQHSLPGKTYRLIIDDRQEFSQIGHKF